MGSSGRSSPKSGAALQAQRDRPAIAVSMGDPGGIGPETIVKALADRELRRTARFHVFGLAAALEAAAEAAGIEPFWWRVAHGSAAAESALVHDVLVLERTEFVPQTADGAASDRSLESRPGLMMSARPAPTAEGGAASIRFLEDAIASSRLPEGDAMRTDAICTAPISKEAWRLAGQRRFPGHTELLKSRFRAKRAGMLFVGPSLRVMLATVHIPLLTLRDELTIGRIFEAIELAHEACLSLGVAHPRIAVCGLNPHAGENGLLGDEDERLIDPAVRLAQEQRKIDARGPFPADTLFGAAAAPPMGEGRYDCVVAMYHDQGLIPVKLLDRDLAVNVTVGLPVPRTSPAHGTAFDIAGRNIARPASMRAALELAVSMANRSRAER